MIEGESDLARNNALTSKAGLTLGESQKGFDKWAPTYDQDSLVHGYSAHLLASKYLCDVIPPDSRATSRVLDIGAGSGLVAKELCSNGFKKIDALDPNESMLKYAREQNLYEKYYLEFITAQPTSIPESTYDAVTGSGIYAANNYVPSVVIHEIIRVVKPGGYVVLVARNMLFGPGQPYEQLEPLMAILEKNGKWKQVHRDILPSAYFTKLNIDAIVWVYRKL
ncbi:methyltransferase-like protein 27 [Mya arenaria]|uniref:methyltransferase-like protein 27 n=1 Tax=Mya arenaria TaxID=6604 RepID=UPI0022E1400A|nr:methyltransferase-like protein 27 [Mya arenaria]